MSARGTFRPIFIVGTSRSGTTMMNRVLGGHPMVLGMNELHFFGDLWDPSGSSRPLSPGDALLMASVLLARVRKGVWGGAPDERDVAGAQACLSDAPGPFTPGRVFSVVMAREAAAAGAEYVTEQTPRNIIYAHRLLKLYPEARIVHMIRDPRAVLFSQKNRWRQKWLGAGHIPLRNTVRVFVNYHPYTLTRLWEKSVRIGRSLAGHPGYRAVSFEDLLDDPKKVVGGLCDFLRIPFDERMLDVPQVGSSNKVHREDVRGIARDVADGWRGKLPKGDIAVCEMAVAGMMRELGYEPLFQRPPLLPALGPLLKLPFHLAGTLVMNPRIVRNYLKSLRDKS